MTLQKISGMSLWWQIAETLQGEIRSGVFGPGDQLPTEMDLARRFGVNRHTVRRAVATLQDRGLLRVEQGRGTFVHEEPIAWPVGRRVRFTEIIQRQQRSPSGELLRTATIPADENVARNLSLPQGAPVILLVTLNSVDGRPLSLGDHYFPGVRFKGLDQAYRETRSITSALRGFGIEDYSRKLTRVMARLPEAEEAEALHLARSRPVLVTEAVNVDAAGQPIEFGIARSASDRLQIVIES